MSQMVAPDVTTAPTCAASPVMVPLLCAFKRLFHLHGLEDDDEVTRRHHGRRRSTATLTIVPCMGAINESPDAPEPDLLPRRSFRAPAFLGPAPPRAAECRRATRLRGACHRPRPRRSLARAASSAASAAPANGGILVVELGLDPAGVHGERVCGEGRVADDGPVERAARWPCRRRPSRPGRGGCAASASSRVAPGDDQLGEQRVERAADDRARSRSPESTRTPGPAAARYRPSPCRAPGRKSRPGSSPLIRNSNAVAAAARDPR